MKLQLEREQRCKDHSLEIDQARSVDVLISTCGHYCKLQMEMEQRCKDLSLEIDQTRSVDVLISTCGHNCKLQLEREQRCKDHSLETDQAGSVDVLISIHVGTTVSYSWRGSRGARITPWRVIRLGQ